MGEYDSTRALVTRLIAKKGTSVGLYRVGAGVPSNADRPWKADGDGDAGDAADDVLLATVPAVFLSPIEARGIQGQFAFPVFQRSTIDVDSLTPETTHMVYISAEALEAVYPEGVEEEATGLLVVRGSDRYVVLRSQALRPGDQAVLYVFSVKG